MEATEPMVGQLSCSADGLIFERTAKFGKIGESIRAIGLADLIGIFGKTAFGDDSTAALNPLVLDCCSHVASVAS